MEERPREGIAWEFCRLSDLNISHTLHCRFCRKMDCEFFKKHGNLVLENHFYCTMKYKALV
jgi:hypothetical protein